MKKFLLLLVVASVCVTMPSCKSKAEKVADVMAQIDEAREAGDWEKGNKLMEDNKDLLNEFYKSNDKEFINEVNEAYQKLKK